MCDNYGNRVSSHHGILRYQVGFPGYQSIVQIARHLKLYPILLTVQELE